MMDGMNPTDDVRKEHGMGTPNETVKGGVRAISIPTPINDTDMTHYEAAAKAAGTVGSPWADQGGKASGKDGSKSAKTDQGK